MHVGKTLPVVYTTSPDDLHGSSITFRDAPRLVTARFTKRLEMGERTLPSSPASPIRLTAALCALSASGLSKDLPSCAATNASFFLHRVNA